MLGYFWKKKDNSQFNLNNSYMIIEFLTEDQKIQKDKIIERLQKQYKDDLQTIVPYSTSFYYSFRYTLHSNNIKNKILLAEVMALVEVSNNEELNQFYETNVQKIKLHMKNNKLINAQDVLQLYNEMDVSLYNPPDVLEIIYQRRGFFNRMKVKTKKIVKDIPKYLMNIFSKFLGVILNFMGLGSVSSVISSLLPIKMVLKWALNFLMIFFPALAPLIGLSKLVI